MPTPIQLGAASLRGAFAKPQPKRILVVDDSAALRESVCKILSAKTNYEVSEAVDGLDAVAQAKKLRPDLVVLDARMPSLNGIEAASIIKRELQPSVRIILLTQYANLIGKSVISASGIDIMLSKSDGLNKLLGAVEKLLQ